MSIDACAALIARADPDRWAAVLAAPPAARAALIVLYAYNVEISRAPWASSQPLIAQMRLQWWRDILLETTPRAHEVAAPLQALIAQGRVDVAVLDAMARARLWDIHSEPFENMDDFDAYIDDTAGGLVLACAQALGGRAGHDYGRAMGIANFLRASAELTARGRKPLLDTSDAGIAALAQRGLKTLNLARSKRRDLGAAWPAALACVQAGALLRKAARYPHLVRQGALNLAPAGARARLIWASITRKV
jgi:phytoene synthase